MKRFLNFLTAGSVVLGLLFLTVLGTANYFTPNSYTVSQGGSLSWNGGMLSVTESNCAEVPAGTSVNSSRSAELMLYHAIPLKTVQLNVVDDTTVILCGTPFGIKMFTNGVVVVSFSEIQTKSGLLCPAESAGIQSGDIVLSVNGKNAGSNTDVEATVENSGGKTLRFTVNRSGQILSFEVQPVKSESDGQFKIGMWVRDSTAGIGTMTFYDPTSKCFAGLGHGICDADTGRLMPLLSGDIVPVAISGITKGEKGSPGELRGYFSDSTAMGTLWANSDSGVYGTMDEPVTQGTTVQIAMKQEVKAGPAQILATVDGEGPKLYDVQIEQVDYRDGVQSKNMVLRVTDAALIAQTGGIVQGMSGSPILQEGRLVGAVTHVFVNDPTRGYGIFAENMLETARSTGEQQLKEAS